MKSTRLALCDASGPLKDLHDRLAGEEGEEWLQNLKLFLRKENPWETEPGWDHSNWLRLVQHGSLLCRRPEFPFVADDHFLNPENSDGVKIVSFRGYKEVFQGVIEQESFPRRSLRIRELVCPASPRRIQFEACDTPALLAYLWSEMASGSAGKFTDLDKTGHTNIVFLSNPKKMSWDNRNSSVCVGAIWNNSQQGWDLSINFHNTTYAAGARILSFD